MSDQTTILRSHPEDFAEAKYIGFLHTRLFHAREFAAHPVIEREYGLPAVVGVENATRLIKASGSKFLTLLRIIVWFMVTLTFRHLPADI